MITKINIDASKLDTQERRDKMGQVALEMHTVINSTIFRDNIMRMKTWGETSKYKDIPNAQIYKMIMEGAEVLDPVVDYEMDIFINDYFSLRRVIGYTMRNIKTIFVNTRYFDKNHTREIGSNVLHEYGHKLGFGHDFKATERRPFSICYQLNGVYVKTYNKLFAQSPSKVKICTRSWKSLWLIKRCKWVDSYNRLADE